MSEIENSYETRCWKIFYILFNFDIFLNVSKLQLSNCSNILIYTYIYIFRKEVMNYTYVQICIKVNK